MLSVEWFQEMSKQHLVRLTYLMGLAESDKIATRIEYTLLLEKFVRDIIVTATFVILHPKDEE